MTSRDQSATASGTSKQFVTAFFDSRGDADDAVKKIVALGVSHDDIRIIAGEESAGNEHGEKAGDEQKKDKGLLASLADILMPDEDRHTYAEGLNRGGYVVSINTTAENRDQIIDILDDEGTVDMDKREASWRADGWKGFRTDSSVTGHIKGSRAGVASEDESPVVDEDKRVGKRRFDAGRARVRSYVVDTSPEK